jgi:hypothetical protein
MGKDIVRPRPAAAAPPGHSEVLSALLDIKGTIRLSQEVAGKGTSRRGALLSARCSLVLTLAEAALERLYEQLDAAAIRNAWPVAADAIEVTDHG